MDDNQSVNSFASWISTVTTCEPIEKALSRFNGNNKFQRNVLELVTSLKNSILNKGGKETSTEFYAALISFLSATEVNVETMEASVYILKHLMKQNIPIPVLRQTTSTLSKIILRLFSGTFSKSDIIVSIGLFCLSKLIAIQPDESWELENTAHLYRTLFSFVTDSRASINKTARKSVLSIFYTKSQNGKLLQKKHPLNRETITILTNSIKTQNLVNNNNASNYKKYEKNKDLKVLPSPEEEKLSFSLSMIAGILKSKLFNNECIVLYLEKLIQCLLSLQIVPIQCQILNILSELFIGRVLFPEQIARCLTSLFTYLNICSVKSNNRNSSTPVPSYFIGGIWLNTVLMGFESLILNENETFVDSETNKIMNCRFIALSHASNLIKFCSDWLLCDDDEFKKTSLAVLNKLCSGSLNTSESKIDLYLDPLLFNDADNWLSKWTESICRLLFIENLELSTKLLDNLICLIVRSKGKCDNCFIKLILQCVPRICELRDTFEDTEAEIITSLTKNRLRDVKSTLSEEEKLFRNSAESFIGNIIKFYGLNQLFEVISLMDIMDSDDSSMDLLSTRTWIVPLMKAYVQNTSLDQFRLFILPCIQLITKKIDSLSNSNQMETDNSTSALSVASLSLGTLRYQLWSCLPSFAKHVIPGSIQQVTDNLIELHQYPHPFPIGLDYPSVTLWNLLVDLLNPNQTSNLEIIVLQTIRNLVVTAQDKEEMKTVLTGEMLFPKILQNMFSLYMKKENGIQMNLKSTMDVYLQLFEPETFDINCQFLINKKLGDLNITEPTDDQLSCIELLIILGPHLSESTITQVTEFLMKYLDNTKVDHQIQKRVYRYFEIITASNTVTSNEYTKKNLSFIIEKFKSWKTVKTDSWKCRMKTIYNLFKLLNTTEEISGLLNGFLSEIIGCLNIQNKKTRAVSGLMLVEGILACYSEEDNEEIVSIGNSIDRMMKQIVACLKEKINDNSPAGIQYKSALAKALYLIVSEDRLARSVNRTHITDIMSVIVDILQNHHDDKDNNNNNNRHLIYCAMDILGGLLKKKTGNFNNIYIVDIGQCLHAANHELRMKIRLPIKKILKKMLKLWDYELIKKCIPEELIAVLRNIHKSMNRSKRNNKTEQAEEDNLSFATSWGGFSDCASQNTMKNPHIKNIAELLHDSDEDSDDEDLKTRMSTTTSGNRSMKSTQSTANELRKARKRKMDEANSTLQLVENADDPIDLSDPIKLVQNMRIADKKVRINEEVVVHEKTDKTVDKRGFHFQDGRLVIGNANNKNSELEKKTEEESEDENYQSKKDRFQPPKKRERKEKIIGHEYRSNKKGAFGDKMGKDKVQPFAYVPLKTTDQCYSVMTKYEKEIKKAHSEARKMSKVRKQQKR